MRKIFSLLVLLSCCVGSVESFEIVQQDCDCFFDRLEIESCPTSLVYVCDCGLNAHDCPPTLTEPCQCWESDVDGVFCCLPKI